MKIKNKLIHSCNVLVHRLYQLLFLDKLTGIDINNPEATKKVNNSLIRTGLNKNLCRDLYTLSRGVLRLNRFNGKGEFNQVFISDFLKIVLLQRLWSCVLGFCCALARLAVEFLGQGVGFLVSGRRGGACSCFYRCINFGGIGELALAKKQFLLFCCGGKSLSSLFILLLLIVVLVIVESNEVQLPGVWQNHRHHYFKTCLLLWVVPEKHQAREFT